MEHVARRYVAVLNSLIIRHILASEKEFLLNDGNAFPGLELLLHAEYCLVSLHIKRVFSPGNRVNMDLHQNDEKWCHLMSLSQGNTSDPSENQIHWCCGSH